MYRIAWKSRITKYQAHGDETFPTLEACEKEVFYLNCKWPDVEHWAEKIKHYEEEQTF